ncbi:hypothetical protein NQ317_010042 [Molorchus minor]|uniref:DNA-PKcs N-terminal domain-containing protein n=1 Tax=Molorchus minor TaxID=1323400 RepID=A0ABQ9J6J7_9CUCU|nr:hypothetical protein NQ317_010042 [Molorchus minor]
MDVEPQKLFADLTSFSKDEKKGPTECLRLMEILNRFLIEEQVNSSIIDLYLIHIFNKSHGLIRFLNEITKNKNLKNAAIKGVEILYTLVSNFDKSRLAENNVLDIYSLCINIIQSDAPADVKVKVLELLLISLQKYDICMENNEVSSVYQQILASLQNALKQKHSDTGGSKDYLSQKYNYYVSNSKEIQLLFVRHFESELVKSKKSQYVVCGFFTGFSYYCEIYPLDDKTDKVLIQRLYELLKILVVPKDRTRIGNRAAMLFLANNGTVFRGPMLKDYKYWHNKLLNWLNTGDDDKKSWCNCFTSLFSNHLCVFK